MCIYVCVCKYMYIHTYIYTHTHMYTFYVYVSICIYTYIFLQEQTGKTLGAHPQSVCTYLHACSDPWSFILQSNRQTEPVAMQAKRGMLICGKLILQNSTGRCWRRIQGTLCIVQPLTASTLNGILRSKYHKESYAWLTQFCLGLVITDGTFQSRNCWPPLLCPGAWYMVSAAGLLRELGEKMLEPNEDTQLGFCQLYLL